MFVRAGGVSWRVDKFGLSTAALDSIASTNDGDIAVDGKDLYWTNADGSPNSVWQPGEPVVFRLPKIGAERASAFVKASTGNDSIAPEAHGIAVDDSCVYWAQFRPLPGLDGVVFKRAK